MKRGKAVFEELEAVLPRERAEAFCAWVREAWGLEPVWMEKPGRVLAVVSVYEEAGAGTLAARAGEVPRAEFGVRSVRLRRCEEKEWSTFWRHHFRTTDIGRRFRTVPAWEKCPDRKRINLRLDPGMSFGTGCHFTTRFCLEELERACGARKVGSMLDAGAGSGILAMAAAKLGVERVVAFDFDPVCVAQFPANRRLNRLGPGAVRYELGNVLRWGRGEGKFDVVCANILSHILIAAAPRLWRLTGWRLVLAGIREVEADEVAAAFLRLGARETTRDGDGEWCGIVMERSGRRG
jgi:ribosomal protein L11 methyltransferase